MKKIYAFAVVLIFTIGSATGQTFYWIGADNGNWDDGNNWSATSGGSAAGAFPQATTHDVILNVNAVINLNTSVSINSVSVTGTNTSAKIVASGGYSFPRSITVNSTSILVPALHIGSTCRLENGAAMASEFRFAFSPNSQASINGDWYFTGDIEDDAFAYFELPLTGASTAINVNSGGSITIGASSFIAPNETTGDDFLIFNAGASLNLQGNGPIIPVANYHDASVINITGVTDATVSFEETGSVGTINYNCPGQVNGSAPLYLALLTFSVNGNLNILNTNNNELALLAYTSTSGLPSRDATIKGNLDIQGNSVVAVAHNDGPELPNNLAVEGNLIMNGTSLSLHTGPYIASARTRLLVKGNIQHTDGILTALSTVVNETTDLYVIELNGAATQTIQSVTNSFDNTAHQVTLRMNNAAGVTLSSNLQVGRLDFSSVNKGVITTGNNILTINNTTPVSVSSIVVNSPSNTGYVNGNVQRKTASDEPAVLPVGAGGYRGVTIIPSTNAATTYEARYFITGHSDLDVLWPLDGVSPDYYWDVARIGNGADAQVQLSLPGAVPGSQSNYGLVVAKFNGADWQSAKGTTGTMIVPGDATSGTVKSEVLTTFSSFTIGFGAQSALPTVLVSFDAKKTVKETIALTWNITYNSTPEVFEIMRSADGINFIRIGEVRGEAMKTSYTFDDRNILAGNNYYRLRMIDRDGSITYSVIVVVANGTKGVFMHAIAPTLVSTQAKIIIQSSADHNMQLVVTDINGRIVHKQSVSLTNGNQNVWLDASRFARGMFQVTGYVGSEKTATLRFIKL
jgi:hypothetical protein